MWRWWLSFSVVKLSGVCFARIGVNAWASAVKNSYIARVVELVYRWNLGILLSLVRAADCSFFGCFRVELGVGSCCVGFWLQFLPGEATAQRGSELYTRRAHAI